MAEPPIPGAPLPGAQIAESDRPAPSPQSTGAMSPGEFIALMAMLLATVAFSIDAMLPALPGMAADLSPQATDRVSLVIAAFLLGMGLGTLFTGPLSDAFGRRQIILGGMALYILAAMVASVAQSLEMLLIARVVQGLGAAGPRIVSLAVVRDLYGGREMARIVSFIMVVFTLVPVLAPTLGAGIAALAGWRGIFGAFVLFAVLGSTWLLLRLPETLPAPARRAFRPAMLGTGLKEIWAIPMVRLAILVQTTCFTMLYAILSSTQLIFDQTFGQGDNFHYWFGGIALVAGSSGFLNAGIVRRFGMRAIISVMLAVSSLGSLAMALSWVLPISETAHFAAFLLWQTLIFFQAGMTIGNLNALAMEPLGHIAGLAASVIGAISTVGAALLTVPIALAFDGTPLPLSLALTFLAIIGFTLTLRMRRLERVTRVAP